MKFIIKLLFLLTLFGFTCHKNAYSQTVKEIKVLGNQRIPSETILMFSDSSVSDNFDINKINNILKNLYETNYFEDVNVSINNDNLIIKVKENPIIENINYNGIKSNSLKQKITKDLKLKSRSSYNEFLIKNDKQRIISSLKNLGYYNPVIDVFVEDLTDNKINLEFDIDIGSKAKIKKIRFIGNKIFKDSKLKNIIASEEYKFWKFISGKKYLNENLVKFDTRLLKNFYRNRGYYNAEINSSFARLLSTNEFELIYNINANNIVYFGDLILDLPVDYDKDNFLKLLNFFEDLKGEKYSFNLIQKILDQIDEISINEQYQSIKATVNENIIDNQLNLTFKIEETEKFYVKKINILGNNVTEETVIRNNLEIDEGDPFNEILMNKSINNIKSLNFFRSVNKEIINENNSDKIINIYVEEKPTGQIAAGAGFRYRWWNYFFQYF
jgi:outer membrane protein insertion porin family